MKIFRLSLAAVAAVSLLSVSAHAASYTWNSTTGGTWDDTGATGWNTGGGGDFPNAAGAVAVFDQDITATFGINLNISPTIGQLVMRDPNASNTMNFSGTGGLIFDNGSSTALWDIYSAAQIAAANSITLNSDLLVRMQTGLAIMTQSGTVTGNGRAFSYTGLGAYTGQGYDNISALIGDHGNNLFTLRPSGSIIRTGAGDPLLIKQTMGANTMALTATTANGISLNNGPLTITNESMGRIAISTQLSGITDLTVNGIGGFNKGNTLNPANGSNNFQSGVILSGSNNSVSGTTTVNAAHLFLDFNTTAGNNAKIGGGPLNLNNGLVTFSGTKTTVNVGGLNLANYSYNQINVVRAAASGTTIFNAGAITQGAESGLLINSGTIATAVNVLTTSNTNSNGILGAQYVIGAPGVAWDWASVLTSSTVGAYTGYTALTTTTNTNGLISPSVNLGAATSSATINLTGAYDINSLRVNNNGNATNASLIVNTNANPIVLNSGGLLLNMPRPVTVGVPLSLTNNVTSLLSNQHVILSGSGLISGATSSDNLFLTVNTGYARIDASLIGGAGRLVKNGDGAAVLTGASTMGGITVNAGVVDVRDSATLPSGALRLGGGGQLQMSGTLSRTLGTDLFIGQGGGGFSAGAGDLTVTLAGVGAALDRTETGGNLFLSHNTVSEAATILTNPIDTTGDFMITVGANSSLVGKGSLAAHGAAYAKLTGLVSGTGAFEVFGPSNGAMGQNAAMLGSTGMLVPTGGLSYTGNTYVQGSSLYVDSMSKIPAGLVTLSNGGVIATHGNESFVLGAADSRIHFGGAVGSPTGFNVPLRTGGFAAVGGDLAIDLTTSGTDRLFVDPANNSGSLYGLLMGNEYAGYTVDLTSTTSINGGNALNLGAAGPVVQKISGKVTGAGSIITRNNGVIEMSNTANDFTGRVDNNGGILRPVGSPESALGVSGTFKTIGLNSGGTFDLNGFSYGSAYLFNPNNGTGWANMGLLINTSTNTATITNMNYSAGSTVLTFSGPGNITVTGSTSNAQGGSTNVGNGTVTFAGPFGPLTATDYRMQKMGGGLAIDNRTDNSNKLLSAVSSVTLTAAAVSFYGNDAANSTLNVLSGTGYRTSGTSFDFQRGGNSVTVYSGTGAGTTATLNMGVTTTSNGGAADFRIVNQGLGAGVIVTSNTNGGAGTMTSVNNTHPGRYTFNGTTYATVSSGTVAGFSSYNSTDFSALTITDIGSSTALIAGSATTASIRFNDASNPALTLTGATLVAGHTSGMGVLVTSALGANTALIDGGTLNIGANAELQIHQYNTGAPLVISSQISGANASLYKSGPGTAVYSGPFGFNGLVVFGGVMEVTGTNVFNSGGTSVQAVGNNATLRYSGTTGPVTSSKALTVYGDGTFENSSAFLWSVTAGANRMALQQGGGYSNATFAGTGDFDIKGILLGDPTVAMNQRGLGSVTKTGAGMLRVSGTSIISGGVFVDGGTFDLTTDGNLQQDTAVTIANGSVMNVSDSANKNAGVVTLTSGTITSTGGGTLTVLALKAQSGMISAGISGGLASLTKTSSGLLELQGASTYALGTYINGGELKVNNTAGSATGGGAVTVSPGALLSGTGSIGGALSVSGTVAPGNSVGTLTINNNVTFGAGGTLRVELDDAANTSDKLTINGNLDLSGVSDALTISLLNSTPTVNSFIIASYTGTLSGTFDTVNGLPSGYSLDYGTINANAITLVIPEPSAFLMLAGGIGMLTLIRRRPRA